MGSTMDKGSPRAQNMSAGAPPQFFIMDKQKGGPTPIKKKWMDGWPQNGAYLVGQARGEDPPPKFRPKKRGGAPPPQKKQPPSSDLKPYDMGQNWSDFDENEAPGMFLKTPRSGIGFRPPGGPKIIQFWTPPSQTKKILQKKSFKNDYF